MKKETFNLVIRALIGVAASLMIVGAMGLITEAQGQKTIMEQASGLKAAETVMTVDGENVSVEEYLYWTVYSVQDLSYYGVTDLNTDLGDGTTAADYAASQAEGEIIYRTVLRAWAKELGVTLNEEDLAALQAQKDTYGDESAFQQMLRLMGTSEKIFDTVMSHELLQNHVYELYCSEGGAMRPADSDLVALADEHKLMTAKMLYLDTTAMDEAAKAAAVEQMEGYAAQLAEAEEKAEVFDALAAELGIDAAPQTYDCCEATTFNDALMALAVGEVSAVVEEEGVLYMLLRTELDLDVAAYMYFNEEYSHRVSQAVVEYNEKVLDNIHVAAFYTKYIQLQQNAYNATMQG